MSKDGYTHVGFLVVVSALSLSSGRWRYSRPS